ncbi:MAG: nuclear transport factor 2 family protein [Gemmatimonadaceae bacterium]|nr:nuclear transport factor 2 family protein [Gemmatimonadaceae bacterium]
MRRILPMACLVAPLMPPLVLRPLQPVSAAALVSTTTRPSGEAATQATPAQRAQSLLDADRAYAASSASKDLAAALAPMLATGVIMPTPGGFAIGKDAVLAALHASPDAAAHVTWNPVRVGISADGLHGFTFGYMTISTAGTNPNDRNDSTRTPAKYMTYWALESGTWRALAFKRGRAAGTAALTLMTPALPSALVPPTQNAAVVAAFRRELMAAENTFSATAQRIGLGHAFAEFGSDDAVNMGGAASGGFVVGAAAIAARIGGADMKASPVTWGADTAFVASSGDLGITFGVIRPVNPPPGASPASGNSFFTIWRRANTGAPWKYVAE